MSLSVFTFLEEENKWEEDAHSTLLRFGAAVEEKSEVFSVPLISAPDRTSEHKQL